MSNPQTNHELSAEADSLPEVQFNNFINRVGNHEAKLLTAAILLCDIGGWYTKNSLGRDLIERQGDQPGWLVSETVGFSYCQRDLEPIGLVTHTMDTGRHGQQVNAYMAAKSQTPHYLALIGATLEWSLICPEVSVQKIFGASNTISGSRHSSEVRHQIYEILLSSPDAVAVSDINRQVGITSQVNSMRDDNILIPESKVKGRQLAVKLSDEFRPAIDLLLDELMSVKNGHDLSHYQTVAQRIIDDPRSFSALMAKAKRFSPSYQGKEMGRDSLSEHVMTIAKELGRVTTVDIQEKLKDRSIRNVTHELIRIVLNDLIEHGQIEPVNDPTPRGPRNRKKIYKPADAE